MSNDGVWILEISYLGSVIQNLVYDIQFVMSTCIILYSP